MSDLERLGDEAQRELARFEPAPGLVELVAVWPRAVGPEIARNAWPARVSRSGTLHVATSSSTWAFELKHLEADLLERLGALLGEGVPKELRFAPGPLPSPPAEPAEEASRPEAAVSPETRRRAESLAAEIEDEELRRLVARAAATSLERAASDRSVW
jgi:hypothetical protein